MKWMKMALVAATLVAGSNAARAESVSCYGGGQLGYAMSNTSVDLFVPQGTILGLDGIGASGMEFSIKGGCDANLGGGVIAGLFADYTWHNDHTASVTFFGTEADVGGFDTQWSIGGRLGYEVLDSAMIYALVAYTEADTEGLINQAISEFTGVSLGGGVELELGAGFVGSLEYRYTDFENERLPVLGANLNIDPDMHSVRAGLSYKFISF